MFIKYLTIASSTGIIREMKFKSGLNLIIDNTPTTKITLTGNNVGKTTVLKLIDFCLGSKSATIFTDAEHKKEIYDTVKDFLIDNEVIITLTLVEDLNDSNSKKVVIKRNFLSNKKAIRSINGITILDKEFEGELLKLLIPHQKAEKPTFRQIISHNIRYKDENINNTLKVLSSYTSDVEYEALYLFLLGCTFDEGEQKQALSVKLKQEELFKKRLEKKQTKRKSEMALSIIEADIAVLNKEKYKFNLNENFEKDLEMLNLTKYKINKSSSSISQMLIKKELIEEAQKDLEKNISSIDLKQLRIIYSEAKLNIQGIQKTFEDLVDYHNKMLFEKANFIQKDLPPLINLIKVEKRIMTELLSQEKEFSKKVAKGESLAELEKIITELNEKYRFKGEYESIISQLNESDNIINGLCNELENINKKLFSNNFDGLIKNQVNKFNRHFSAISQELYGEKYALAYEQVVKKNRKVYQFSAFNTNMSSGKKQGEILCFDLAYTLFADDENISCLHFLLNDKKELMHHNQLIQVSEFVQNNNIQLIVSILKDKLPKEALDTAHTVIELSQECKLFKIENCLCDRE